jgi:hypothetical protein
MFFNIHSDIFYDFPKSLIPGVSSISSQPGDSRAVSERTFFRIEMEFHEMPDFRAVENVGTYRGP